MPRSLPEAASYDDRDLQLDRGSPLIYETYEIECTSEVRLGPGFVLGTATAVVVRGFPPSQYLFEENLRVVAAPPVILRGRLGYLFASERLGARIGPAAEVLDVPGRDAVIVRAGAMGIWEVNAHVDAVVAFLPVVSSPDAIGLAGADFSQLGVRIRTATK